MKRIVMLLLILGVLGAGAVVYARSRMSSAPVHYHAGFVVYIDGKKQDYSDARFMNVTPCGEHDTPGNDQVEKAHLHGGIGDVVHVHRNGAVWGDLFRNIGVSFPYPGTVTGYMNGRKIPSVLSQPIRPYESAVIIAGPQTGIDVQSGVSPDHIREVESQSESCGS